MTKGDTCGFDRQAKMRVIPHGRYEFLDDHDLETLCCLGKRRRSHGSVMSGIGLGAG